MAAPRMTGVEANVGFFPLAFFLFACRPRIEIDGVTHTRPWGTHFFELAPGRHTISIYFAYLFKPKCGLNSITVDVQPGQVTRIRFYMPPWMFAKGSLKVVR